MGGRLLSPIESMKVSARAEGVWLHRKQKTTLINDWRCDEYGKCIDDRDHVNQYRISEGSGGVKGTSQAGGR